jgi:hypothetical protein
VVDRVEQGLAERVHGASWYHTMRLPGGVVTRGNFDTIAELERVPLPVSLAGKRCLDVGTADGFWAFEMERRGAKDVLAVDLRDPAALDWPGVPKTDAEMRSLAGLNSISTADLRSPERLLSRPCNGERCRSTEVCLLWPHRAQSSSPAVRPQA